MVLDWKKVAIAIAIMAMFTTLAVLRLISPEIISAGVTGMITYMAGLFTPTPKLPEVKS
jgi:hypothetical protein